jgi:hypothetical protein
MDDDNLNISFLLAGLDMLPYNIKSYTLIWYCYISVVVWNTQ